MGEEIYTTRRVQGEVPMNVIRLMIEMAKVVEETDYLQVFNIRPTDEFSVLKLSQEVPVYERTIKISWISEQEIKLFFMDNVLMFTDEY